MKYFFSLLFLASINLYSQVAVSVDSLSFPQVMAGNEDSLSFYLKNISSTSIDVSIKSLKSVYTVSDTLVSIFPGDSLLTSVKYKPNQNVIDRDLIIISSNDSVVGSVVGINGSGKFGDSYDAVTFNLYDTQLKSALTALVSGHTSLGYNLARDKMYMEIDNKKVNGQGALVNTLECVYTGREAVGYTNRTDAQNNYNFNTEHTWPQSNFNENEPMKSDLYHLYPTDVNANSIRANYPFGKVVSAITWDSAGSKLGRNSLNQIVFEPRDIHKGDVSRSMFYFLIRYPQNYGGFFTSTQETFFREWNVLDEVGAVESARNNAVASFQMKRNPFIDHPEFVERIFSFATSNVQPVISILDALPLKINFDSTQTGDSTLQHIYIANKGNGQLVVDSISVSDSRFKIGLTNFSIEGYSHKKIPVQFKPDSANNYNSNLTVYSNAGNAELVLTGIGKDNTVDVRDEINSPLSFMLEQNFPNPFNPTTKIRFSIPVMDAATTQVRLTVYDILGNEIALLVNEEKPAGDYEVEFSSYDELSSGIYFFRLQAGSFIESKKMLLLK